MAQFGITERVVVVGDILGSFLTCPERIDLQTCGFLALTQELVMARKKPKHSADSNPAFASVRLLFRGWGAGMLRQAEFAVTCWSQTSYGIARAHAVDGCGIRLWHHRSGTQRNDL